jgi:cell division protein FtsN
MAKDYKDSPSPRGEGRTSHPLLLGMIIGLLLGIVIALAVALWLNRLSNPFVEKGRATENLPKIGPTQPPPPPEAAKAVEQAAKGTEAPKPKPAEKSARNERPRFEFYQILPGDKEVTDKEVKAAMKPTPAVTTSKTGPGSSPNMPKPHTGETYWLQAGAFSEEREADNLKARIALIGLEALVRPVQVPDKGTLYRVRLGPYQNLDDANRNKAALSENGVGAAIIRATEEPKTQ